jgi:hypothetical protein
MTGPRCFGPPRDAPMFCQVWVCGEGVVDFAGEGAVEAARDLGPPRGTTAWGRVEVPELLVQSRRPVAPIASRPPGKPHSADGRDTAGRGILPMPGMSVARSLDEVLANRPGRLLGGCDACFRHDQAGWCCGVFGAGGGVLGAQRGDVGQVTAGDWAGHFGGTGDDAADPEPGPRRGAFRQAVERRRWDRGLVAGSPVTRVCHAQRQTS